MMKTWTREFGSWAVMVALVVGTAACNGGGEGQQTETGLNDGGGTMADGSLMDTDGDGRPSDAETDDTGDESDAADVEGEETDTGKPSVYGECRQTCDRARDCGFPDEWVCEDSGYCDFHQCNEDIECVPSVSGWAGEGCSVGECQVDGDICIKHNGTTYCATEQTEGSCDRFGFEPTSKQKADDSGEVQVCSQSEPSCNDNTCETNRGVEFRCEENSDCDGLTCNERNKCACESDQQCIDAKRGDNWECLN